MSEIREKTVREGQKITIVIDCCSSSSTNSTPADSKECPPCRPCTPCTPCVSTDSKLLNTEIQGLDTSVDSKECPPCPPCPPCTPCASTDPESPNTEIPEPDTSVDSQECPPCPPCPPCSLCPSTNRRDYDITEKDFSNWIGPIGPGKKKRKLSGSHSDHSDRSLHAKYRKENDGTNAVENEYTYRINDSRVRKHRFEDSDFDSSEDERPRRLQRYRDGSSTRTQRKNQM